MKTETANCLYCGKDLDMDEIMVDRDGETFCESCYKTRPICRNCAFICKEDGDDESICSVDNSGVDLEDECDNDMFCIEVEPGHENDTQDMITITCVWGRKHQIEKDSVRMVNLGHLGWDVFCGSIEPIPVKQKEALRVINIVMKVKEVQA